MKTWVQGASESLLLSYSPTYPVCAACKLSRTALPQRGLPVSPKGLNEHDLIMQELPVPLPLLLYRALQTRGSTVADLRQQAVPKAAQCTLTEYAAKPRD